MAPPAFGVLPYDPGSRRPWLDLPFSLAEYQGRLDRVRLAMGSHGLERLLLFGAPKLSGNVRWLANFDSFVGYTVVTVPASGDPALVTDSMFRGEPLQSGAWMTWMADYRPVRPAAGDPDGFVRAVVDAAGGAAGGTVGFVGEDFFPYFLAHRLRQAFGPAAIPDFTQEFLQLKAVKTEGELTVVRRAIAIGDAGLRAAGHAIKPGVTEAALAATCVAAMFAAGAHNLYGPFPVNMVAGPRAMLKSVPPSPRPVEHGDLVFMDIEPEYYGYGTDLARTAVAGRATGDQRRMLEAALTAEEAAIAATHAGVTLRDLERVAVGVAEAEGFPRTYYFKVHGLGTTKFRDVPRPHELDYRLRPGEVINFESILVVPGLGQATIEDSLLVTPVGCEVLSTAPRRLW